MGTAKKWEDLGIKDNFIFGKVMQNPDICKRLIETILDISIDHIDYLEKEKSIDITRDAKSVRLDVYVKDKQMIVYNVEMQPVLSGDD